MAIHITRAGVGLTVGIIVVAGLLLGGLLWVKQTGDHARRQDAIKIAEESQKDKQSSDEMIHSPTDTTKQSANDAEVNTSPPSTEAGSSETSIKNDTEHNSNRRVDNDNSSVNGQLPQTGSEDFMSGIVISLVTFVFVGYLQSRRNNQHSRS